MRNDARDLERSPVDSQLYAELAADILAARTPRKMADPNLSRQAELFLYREASLLDERHYREWLTLLAPGFIYWVPSDPAAADARAQSAINFDDLRRMRDRIALIETGFLHAQNPPSRTCRAVSNVEAWPAVQDQIDVRSNLFLQEHRRGRTRQFMGQQEHRIAKRDSNWRIVRKIIRLVDGDEPQGNLTFIL